MTFQPRTIIVASCWLLFVEGKAAGTGGQTFSQGDETGCPGWPDMTRGMH
jgi:hypothetical protein